MELDREALISLIHALFYIAAALARLWMFGWTPPLL
jgi:hypothetical protein